MRWMSLFAIVLMSVGCTIESIEEGEELQEGAPNAPGVDEDTENLGEASQHVPHARDIQTAIHRPCFQNRPPHTYETRPLFLPHFDFNAS